VTAALLTAPGRRQGRLLGLGAIEFTVFSMSLLTGPILSRHLGDDGRGVMAAVVVPVQLLAWVVHLGVPYGSSLLTSRFERRALVEGAWSLALLLAAPLCVVLAFAGPAGLGLGDPASTWFRVGLVAVVLATPAGTAMYLYLIERGGSWRYSVLKSSDLITYSVIVVALAVLGQLTIGTALAAWIIPFVLSRLAILTLLRAAPGGWASSRLVAEQLRGGRAHAGVTLATVSLGRVDQVVLAVMATSAELGHYAVAATAAQLSLPLAKAAADIVLPEGYSAPGATKLVDRTVTLVLGVSATVAALAALTAPWLLPAVFGDDFESSVPLLWCLLPGQVLFNAAWVISARHLGERRAGVAAWALGSAAVANALLLVPAIALGGPLGAALVTTLCQGLFLVAVLRFGNGNRS
jgi:O-antigen/teichoic acid export membrane protein